MHGSIYIAEYQHPDLVDVGEILVRNDLLLIFAVSFEWRLRAWGQVESINSPDVGHLGECGIADVHKDPMPFSIEFGGAMGHTIDATSVEIVMSSSYLTGSSVNWMA